MLEFMQTAILTTEFTGWQLPHHMTTVFVGISLTSIVFLILTAQVAVYFGRHIHKRDSVWIKGFVIFVWTLQALECALSCHMTAIGHSHDSGTTIELAKRWLWEWAIYIATCTVTECLVHGYFVSRIYLLETNRNHTISIILCIILVLEGIFGVLSAVSYVTFVSTMQKVVVCLWSIPAWLGLSIVMDISISAVIYWFLKKNGPIVSTRLNVLVKRLTKFFIQTGLITSLVTVITVALWTAAQLDTGHLLMCFPLGCIYATCMMANLIARESYLNIALIGDDNGSECLEIEPRIICAARGDVEENKISSSEMKSMRSSDIYR